MNIWIWIHSSAWSIEMTPDMNVWKFWKHFKELICDPNQVWHKKKIKRAKYNINWIDIIEASIQRLWINSISSGS